MFNRRYRKCCCMNNNFNNNCNNKDILENSCQNNCPCQNYDNDSCECGFDEDYEDVFPTNPKLAQSYVPVQYMDKTFKPCVGLKMGTIFPELVSPYAPGQSMKEIQYLQNSNEIGEGCNSCN